MIDPVQVQTAAGGTKFPVSDELSDLMEAAYAEMGYSVIKRRYLPDKVEFTIAPFPPHAVMWQVSKLAAEAGLDEIRLCWPCYQADSEQDDCEHDWRTAPQPTRAELVRA